LPLPLAVLGRVLLSFFHCTSFGAFVNLPRLSNYVLYSIPTL
jgi:hypothetical protein